MKKLIVLVLVLGMVGSAQAIIEDFTYPDQALDGNGIGNLVDFSDTGAVPLPEDPRDPWEADIVSNQLQWYGYSAGNAEAHWMEAIDITVAPIQNLSLDFLFDENAVGGRSRLAMVVSDGSFTVAAMEVDSYPQIELMGISADRQYILETPVLDTWYTMELELDFTAATFKGRFGPVGGPMSAWTPDMVMGRSGAQPDRVKMYTNGLTLIDQISLTPEPATIALLGMGALALIRKRR